MPSPSDPTAETQARRESEPLRIAIIGAGPVGIEVALYASRLGYKTLLFEREEEIAPDIRPWAHVSMFTPWGETRTPLGELALREAARDAHQKPSLPRPAVYPTGGEFVERYLGPLALSLGDSLHLETRVVAVGRAYLFPDEMTDQPDARRARKFRLLTRTPRDERLFAADYVLHAAGGTHTPRWAGAGGLPALGEMGSQGRIFYHIPDILGRDRIHFLGKRVLLIGDGTSAATSAVYLSELLDKDPPVTLVWASRSPRPLPLAVTPHDPLPRRDLTVKKANLLVHNGHPRLEFLPDAHVEAIQYSLASSRFQVTLQVSHTTRRLMFDTVIANVGSRPDALTFERHLLPEEPGFFTLGAAAAPGTDFFLAHARTQIRDAFRTIAADPTLDLYAQADSALHAQARLARDTHPE